MKMIPLSGEKGAGKFVLVDDEDFERLNKWSWYYHAGYAARRKSPENKIMMMHREIMMTPKGMDTDHKNNNRLDNRKDNLRICNRSQNNLNIGKRPNNTSGYKGVFWRSDKKLWLARVGKIYAGKFKDKEAAAKAYDKKAKELFGRFAKLNFPET